MSDLKEKENDIKVGVNRLDVMDNTEYWMSEPFQENGEGFLTGRAIVTNIGVFTYKDKEGNIIRELRPPEEVLNFDSVSTLRLKPVTNNHPSVLVNSENIKDFQVGSLGDYVLNDAYAISIPMVINNPETIQEIKDGKVALSCGYTADLEFVSGNWLGQPYDAIQRNIRYNHVAVVDVARAGDLAKMRMDSGDLVSHYIKDKIKKGVKKMDGNDIKLKTIVLDDVSYQGEPELVKSFSLLKKDNEKLNSELTELKKSDGEILSKTEADRDSFKDQLDKANEKIKELENSTLKEDEIQTEVKLRMGLLKISDKLEIEVKDEMSNLEIKKLIISKIFPKVDYTDRDDSYIQARYDAAVEIAEKIEEKKIDSENKKKVLGDKQNSTTQKDEQTYEQRRDEYIEELKNPYKDKGGK